MAAPEDDECGWLRVMSRRLSVKKRTESKRPEGRARTPLTFRALTKARWADLERLFGPRGAVGGCWCMYWRLRRSRFEKTKGEGNRRAFRRIVATAAPTGVLAYADGEPVGWCAVAPREDYPVLERSRILARVDGRPVWSVSCFFIARPFRHRDVGRRLLVAAVDFARRGGARIVEGYPVEPRAGALPDVFAWTGLASAFRRAGFKEILRRSPTRPIMRRRLRAGRQGGWR
jgi:GNAT superfamily N-acetyltransferase